MKVSIPICTYNHEKYLAQALDSVLMQQVDFDYEIIVGEDCSADNTRNILLDYHSRYPERIKPILHEKNVGMHANSVAVLAKCTGEYIALLDGDDYWTDPLKLQKQVDFLDANPDHSLSFTAYRKHYEQDNILSEPLYPPERKQWYTLEDLLHGNMICTPTVMYRRNNIPVYSDWLQEMPAPDYGIFIINAQHGKLGYIDEVTTTYRIHDGGIWSSQSKITLLENRLKYFSMVHEYLGPQYHKYLFFINYEVNYELMELYIQDNNLTQARKHCRQCIIHKPDTTIIETIKLYIKPFIPYRLRNMLGAFRRALIKSRVSI